MRAATFAARVAAAEAAVTAAKAAEHAAAVAYAAPTDPQAAGAVWDVARRRVWAAQAALGAAELDMARWEAGEVVALDPRGVEIRRVVVRAADSGYAAESADGYRGAGYYGAPTEAVYRLVSEDGIEWPSLPTPDGVEPADKYRRGSDWLPPGSAPEPSASAREGLADTFAWNAFARALLAAFPDDSWVRVYAADRTLYRGNCPGGYCKAEGRAFAARMEEARRRFDAGLPLDAEKEAEQKAAEKAAQQSAAFARGDDRFAALAALRGRP